MEEDNVRTWSIEKLWNFIKKETDIPIHIYNRIRYGVMIQMDINDYINGNYTYKPGKVMVKYMRSKMKLKDLYSDIEEREKIAVKWIEENYPEKRVTEPRYA